MVLTRSRLVVATSIAVGVVLISGGALMALDAHEKPASTLIVGCASKTTGDLRLVKHAPACHADERAVTWNMRGKRGTAGVSGADGADGAVGPTGATGPAGSAGAPGVPGGTGPTGPAGAPATGATYASSSSGGVGLSTDGSGNPAGSAYLPISGMGSNNGQPVPTPGANVNPAGGGVVQLIATAANLTSFAAAFQTTAADLPGELHVTAQLYTGNGTTLLPVAGAACTLDFALADPVGSVGKCSETELSIPVGAKRALIVFTATGTPSISQSGYLSATFTTG